MAMVRSSLKGMWNFSCKGGTFLYTQGKMGASFMFHAWIRGLICLLVVASLPVTGPTIIVSILVGGVFLVPLLCGVAAYYALFRPASLSSIIKWFRPPKSVLRSGSTELVMEDIDVHDDGNRDHGASLGVFNRDRKDVADSSNVGIAAEEEDSALGVLSRKVLAGNEEIMEDKYVVLRGRDGGAQEEDNRPSGSLLSQELLEAKSPLEESGEQGTGDSYLVAENQDLESEEAEYIAFHFGDQEREPGEGQSMSVEPSDRDPLEDEFPILETTASNIHLQEFNLPADNEEPYQVQVIHNQLEILEEPKQLEEGLPEEAPEEGSPDDPAESLVVTEDETSIVQEKGIEVPFVVSEPLSEEKEVSAVQEDDVPAPSLESEVSIMEQHSLPVESEPVKLASSLNNVSTVEAAPVPEAVSASASVDESDAKDVEAPEAPMEGEKEKADLALEASASVTDQQSLPVNSEPVEVASSVTDIPAIAETVPVQEAAASVEESYGKEAEAPEAPMVKDNEVEASVEDAGISEADELVAEPDVAKEAASESAAPEVAAEEKAQFVQQKEVEIPLVASEPELEESEVPAVEEEDDSSSLLESEVSTMEQHSLPVASEPVELASSIADVPAVEEAALVEKAAPVELYASTGEALAETVEDPETPVAGDKELKAPVALLEEVKVEEQPVILAPAQEGAAPEAEIPVVEPDLTDEVKAKPSASEAVQEDEDVEPHSAISEPVTEEKETQVVAKEVEAAPTLDSEPLVVEKPSLEEAAPVEDAAPVREGVVEKGEESEAPVVDVEEIKAPVAAREETLAVEGATPEAEAPIDEVEVSKDPAVSEVFAEEAQIVQDKVELPLAASTMDFDTTKVDGASISVSLEPGASVIAEKSLPAKEALQVQQLDPPVEGKVDEAPETEVLVNEPEVPKDATPASIAAEEAPDEGEVELLLAPEAPMGEEKEKADLALEASASVTDQQSLPVNSEPVEVASSVTDIPAIAETVPVQEAAASVEESYGKEAEAPEAPMVKDNEVEASVEDAGISEADELVAEPDVAKEAASESAAPEVAAEEKAQFVQQKEVEIPLVASEPELEESEVPAVEEEDDSSSSLESEVSTMEQHSLPVASEPVELASSIADVPAIAETAEEEAQSVQEKEVELPLLVSEPEVPKDATPASIAAAEKAPDEREVELPLAASNPVSESKEARVVEESLAVPRTESLEAPVVAEKSLPLQEEQVEAAPVEETMVKNVGEPEASAVEKTKGADDTTLHVGSKVDSGTSSEPSTAVKTISSFLKNIVGGFKSQEHGAEDITTSEANAEFERGVGHDRISSDLELPSSVEDLSAVDENVDQASKDSTIEVSNLEVEDAALTSASPSTAQLVERGNEADEDAQKLEENLEKDKTEEIRTEQDVFPTLKPLNVVQNKDYSRDEHAENSDSISRRAPAQRRISFENVRADEEENIGAPLPPHRTDVQGTNFVFKSRLGRDDPTHRHSAPDFLATQSWVREAPLYSPQESFRGRKKAKYKKWPEFEGARPAEPHTGEFERLLQSWQERDKTTHYPTSTSPSGSPRSPAEIGRQIREEISTIQKIIGQEIPPQYSLWKEVETLCQVVGMELPYMGDVSDLTKARQGLDLLKVVVGVKWT